jgi:hypothetical protein
MSISHKSLRRRLANQIEPRLWGIGTTTSAGPATVVSCSDFAMTSGDGDALSGGYINFTSGTLLGQCRAVKDSGLDVGTGDITVGNPFTGATPLGAEFEWHGRYPAKRPGGAPFVAGYLDLLNDALERLWFEDFLAVVGVTGQQRYPLDATTYPWLADQPDRRIMDVYGPADATTGVRTPTTQAWHIEDDAEAPYLVFDGDGWSSSDTFYLKVARPANSRIKIGATWTNVSDDAQNNGYTGLAADSDETHASWRHVLAIAISESFNHLSLKQPQMESADWERRRLYWASVAAECKFRDLPRKNDGRYRPTMTYVGGGMMSRGGGRRPLSWTGRG